MCFTKNKTAKLITIFDNTNFGTYLQAVALGIILKRIGYDVTVLRYIRPFMKYSSRKRAVFTSTRNPLKWLLRLYKLRIWKRLRDKDYDFVARHLPITKEVNTLNELRALDTPADIYITGSDQVWNHIHNKGIDENFYLTFAPSNKPKVAYSASIGLNELSDNEKAIIKSLLSSYSAISVREKQAVDLLGDIGVQAYQTLDPTFLLTSSDWQSMLPQTAPEKENYLLIYSVETKSQDAIIDYVARKVAKEKKLKIYGVYYGGSYNRISCCDKNFYYATPDVFLSLIINATFVVVSSFHGTAFSINLNKQFYTISPARFNSRIDSLLEMCGLQSRKITSNNQEIHTESEINYNPVNKILSIERNKSINYLKSLKKYC